MIKLVAIDLDGSLLNDDKKMPADFWEVAEAVLKKDITMVIASGRPYHNLADMFEKLKNVLYFASDNGTQVVHDGKVLLINQLEKKPLDEFVGISRTLDKVYPVLCSKEVAFIEDTEDDFISTAMRYYQEYKVVDDLTTVDDTIIKISLCDLINAESNSYPYYKRFEDQFSVAVAGRMWLDITNGDGTKGNAIKRIQSLLNITPEETLVFGDYLNDLDMIQNAKYSYAMKNAHPLLLREANYVTELDNNHNGVTHTLRKVFSLQEL